MKLDPGLAEAIAGNIIFSPDPGQAMRHWRVMYGQTQALVASAMGIRSGVISDYESGRRTPGLAFLRRYVLALLQEPTEAGHQIEKENAHLQLASKGITSMHEYRKPLTIREFQALIGADVLVGRDHIDRAIHGHTRVDSHLAIGHLRHQDFGRLYGWNHQRALLFDGIEFGRSPMIALRVHPVQPSCVVYVDPKGIDGLAIELANQMDMVLLRATKENVDAGLERILQRQGPLVD